jgi:hypothetical protein
MTLLLLLSLACAPTKEPTDRTPFEGDDSGGVDSQDTLHDTADTGPTETGDTDTGTPPDTDSADTGDTGDSSDSGGDTSTTEPETWPESSVCIAEDRDGSCAGGIEADDWEGLERYAWRLESRTGDRSVVYAGTTALFDVTTTGWHLPWGLAVARDGDVYLSGSTLGPAEMMVNGVPVDIPETYDRFLVKVSVTGDVRWARSFEGITAEKTVVAPTSDGGAIIAGQLYYSATEIGGFPVPAASWLLGTLVARTDDAGTWQWAGKVPDSSSPIGELQFGHVEPGAGWDVELHGTLRGALTLGPDTLDCGTTGCLAYVTMDETGSFTGIAAE